VVYVTDRPTILGKGLGKVVRAASGPMSPTANSLPATHPDAAAHGHAAPSTRQHTKGLVGALNDEWGRLVADPSHRSSVAGWRCQVSALAPFADLAAILDGATNRVEGEVLNGLLLLARSGDQLAARTVLQAMLGPLVRLARRTVGYADGDLEESLSRAVEAAWRVIRNYPRDRACRPVDGISLDVLAALTGGGRHGTVEVPVGLPADLGERSEDVAEVDELREAFWAAVREPGARSCGDEELIVLFAWAVRARVISRAEARLLLRLHSPEEPGRPLTCREVAQHLGIAHAAVRQRASRATRRLAAAVQAHLGTGQPVAA
jgi:hypothetical protein